MKSKWLHLKDSALKMRKSGATFGQVESEFGIPKSTLSYWFKDIELSIEQKAAIKNSWKFAIKSTRRNAIKWHNQQKDARIQEAKIEAKRVVGQIDLSDVATLEIALAILYLGEGTKKSLDTSLGSSDPKILKFFVICMKKLYQIDFDQAKCYLHLRADQDELKVKKYWAKTLEIPSKNFRAVSFDKRTLGKATFPSYMGVCVVSYGRVAIQRRLMWISRLFCEKIATTRP